MKKLILIAVALFMMLALSSCCNHKPTEWIIDQEPTCVTDGNRHVECRKCGRYMSGHTIPATGIHTETTYPGTPATCTQKGEKDGVICAVCNEILEYGAGIPALGHTEIDAAYVAPTCTTDGAKDGKVCATCGVILEASEKIPAFGHTPVVSVTAQAPTCTDPGYTEEIECKTCGDVLEYSEPLPSLGNIHEYTVGNIVNDAEKGRCVEMICTLCNHMFLVAEGDAKEIELSSSQKEFVGYTGEENEHLVISEFFAYDNQCYRVTKLQDHAFQSCENLESVIIPDSVTELGIYAFHSCTNLKSVVIPDSVTYIGFAAFVDCVSLESVYIPGSVEILDNYTFRGCTSLRTLTLGEGVKYINTGVFAGCTNLTVVNMPDSLVNIGVNAFAYCTSLLSITIPENVEEIYDDAFYYCPKLIEVINHSSLDITADSAWHGYVAASALKVHQGESEIVNVDGYLFYTYDGVNYLVGYIGDEADIVLPESYNGEKYEIYKYAFSKNSYIINVTINDGAVKMGDYAFSECKKLESVNIAGEITDIGQHAFYNTLSLKSVTISESVTHIGYYAFYLCNNLKSVVFENTDGWECSWYSGEEEPTKVSSVDLARPSSAVQYLVNINLYCSAYWNRV